MFDAKGLLDQVMNAAEKYAGKENIDKIKRAAADNPTLTKVGAVGAAGVLLGTGAGRNVLKLGALAGIGGLAYKAYQNYQANQSGGGAAEAAPGELAPPPAGSAFDHVEDEQERALAFLTAMIAAAKSDGEIDSFERERIFGRLQEMGADNEARAFLMDEMMAPLDISKVAALAKTPEQAAEIYTASTMAVRIDTPEERAYLNELAARLNIEPEFARTIEAAVEEERASV